MNVTTIQLKKRDACIRKKCLGGRTISSPKRHLFHILFYNLIKCLRFLSAVRLCGGNRKLSRAWGVCSTVFVYGLCVGRIVVYFPFCCSFEPWSSYVLQLTPSHTRPVLIVFISALILWLSGNFIMFD